MAPSKRLLVTVINDQKFLESVMPMKLCHVKRIERHFASSIIHLDRYIKHFTFNGYTARGSTPLILACQHGELDSVKYLIEKWGVYDFTRAAYYSDPSQRQSRIKIEKASPLFVACFHRHDNIVRYLLEKGADVSARTYDNRKGDYKSEFNGLAPLYGAICDRQPFNSQKTADKQKEKTQKRNIIVRILLDFGADPITDFFRPTYYTGGKPIWMEPMCGVETITTLIDYGLDLKRCDPETGEAILLSVMSRTSVYTEEGSLAIIKKLAEKGADLLVRDASGFTPLLRAADDEHDGGRLILSILDFLLERDDYSQIEKIEAMELVGATILSKAQNAPHFPKAFDYWRRALHLRHQMAEESGSFKKILGRKIGNNVEWVTFAELERLMLHLEEYRIQALLVKLRILSGLDGHRHRFLSTQYIKYISNSTTLENDDKFTQILDIRFEMLDVLIRRRNPLQNHTPSWILEMVEDVDELVSTLSTLQVNHPTLLSFEKLKTSLDLILLAFLAYDQPPIKIIDSKHVDYNNFVYYYIFHDYGSHFSTRLCHLLEMIFHRPEIPNERDIASLVQSLRRLGPYRLGNLLLPACQELGSFKDLALVRVLLEAGADPIVAVDYEFHRNASLHIVAGMSDRKLGDAACLLLVEYGAKLSQVNKAGKTALDIWIKFNETADTWNEEAGGWSARPERCCPLPTLLRLAARVIRVNKIPYANGETPTVLHSLIGLRRLNGNS